MAGMTAQSGVKSAFERRASDRRDGEFTSPLNYLATDAKVFRAWFANESRGYPLPPGEEG